MDRYHSIVGPMVSYHWKPLKNHRVQWLLDYKTIEKPLVPMVARPKTIAKPLVPMVYQTKHHRKTIDTNGCFPTIHSMAMVCMNYENLFKFYSKVTCICQYGPPLGWNYSQDIIILNGDIICWQLFAPVFVKNHVLSRFTQFLWTIEKPLIPMMRRKTIHSMAMVQR